MTNLNLKVAIAQTDFFLGDFEKNCQKALGILKQAQKANSDLLLFPEGGLWAYPPKDFLYQDIFFKIQAQKLKLLQSHLPKGLGLLMPAFIKSKKKLQNGVYLYENNKKPLFFAKEFLPDQSVFFESRYFQSGKVKNNFFYWKKKRIQILICEDLWHDPKMQKPDLLISLNASPYTDQKQKNRLQQMTRLVRKQKCPAVYLNGVGAQDSLIFDGGSFVLNEKAQLLWQGAFFKPDFKSLSIFETKLKKKKSWNFLQKEEQKKQALVLGIKSFFSQTGFSKAHFGLSGGIDSSLVACLAVQALGPKNVKAYFLPGPYTQKISYKLSQQVAETLKIPLIEKNITSLFHTFLEGFFGGKSSLQSLTKQNLQARIRALCLMAIANQTKSLLLATGNKSELAVGYSTLYGDMAGALCPLGDLLKTEVYKLAKHINKRTKIFPQALLRRSPSAELAPLQKDEDELLAYPKLDKLLKTLLTNKDFVPSKEEKQWIQRIHRQEFKRRQAPPILKLSESDLGESWRRPIAHKFPL